MGSSGDATSASNEASRRMGRAAMSERARRDAPTMEAWQRALLEESRVARLGTIAADGRPHLVPVVYALVGRQVVIAVDEKPKRSTKLARIKNIERDPRVTLLVDHYDDDWSQLAWVRIDGNGTVLERGDEYPGALAALRERYPQHRDMALEELPLIVMEAERVVGWRAG